MPPISDIIWTADDSPLGIAQPLGIAPAVAGQSAMLISFGTDPSSDFSLITAGIPDETGFIGFLSGLGGSITPTELNGQTLLAMGDLVSGAPPVFTLGISGLLDQDFFTTITINSNMLATASASYMQLGGNTQWTWNGLVGLSVGINYPVSFT